MRDNGGEIAKKDEPIIFFITKNDWCDVRNLCKYLILDTVYSILVAFFYIYN